MARGRGYLATCIMPPHSAPVVRGRKVQNSGFWFRSFSRCESFVFSGRRQSGLLECLVAGICDLRCRGRSLGDVGIECLHITAIDNAVRVLAPALDGDLLAGIALAGYGHSAATELLHNVGSLHILEKQGHRATGLGYGILAPGRLVIHGYVATVHARNRVIALAAVEHVPVGRTLERVGLGRALERVARLGNGQSDAVGSPRVHGVNGRTLDETQAIKLGNALLCARQVDGIGGVLGLNDILGQLVHAYALSLLDVDAERPQLLRVLGGQRQHVGRTFGRQLAHVVTDASTLVRLQGTKRVPCARKVELGVAGIEVQLLHVGIRAHVQRGILCQGNALGGRATRDGRAAEGVLAVEDIAIGKVERAARLECERGTAGDSLHIGRCAAGDGQGTTGLHGKGRGLGILL